MLLVALAAPAFALDFLQGDAGAPGMAVHVSILRESGGFTGAEVVTTDCADIVVSPSFVLDRGASTAITGSVLSAVFFVDPAASVGDCTVYVDGTALSAFNAGIDNRFSIVAPTASPVDGGTGDADGASDGVITLPSSVRSDGGTVVLESLTVSASETLRFDTTDPVAVTDGNEAFLPVILLVEGAADIEGTVDLAGGDSPYSYLYASDGGDGGPGGGGGGVGSNCIYGPTAVPGDGFTGGGGTALGYCIDYTDGGAGAGEGADGEDGGEGVFTTTENGALGYAGGVGGGTGMVWGTGGGGGYCCGVAGSGGYGGGGGNGHSEASGWGGGGGGFGTSGENGVGVVGGAKSGYQVGGAGLANGDDTLVPLAGGSGGAGGDSGSGYGDAGGGGGGGGSLLLSAASLSVGSAAFFDLSGGDGGDTYGRNPGSSLGGAGGSGGGLHLASAAVSGLSASMLDLSGGVGGTEGSGAYSSGDGGEGRLRVDGAAAPTPGAGPTGATATTWEGPAITAVSGASVTVSGSGTLEVWVLDDAGGYLGGASAADGDTVDVSAWIPRGSHGYVVVSDATEGVIGPASGAWIDDDLDTDGDGYVYSTDCDDDDAAVSPDADESCNGVDDDCDGDVDEESAVDAATWYADADGDGHGDAATSASACDAPEGYVASADDCDDADAAVSPDAEEVCDGVDDDCDGETDEDSAVDASTWYADVDGDGYGDASAASVSCEPDAGEVADATDCDDADATAFPGGTEVCDGADDDCDGTVDEDATDASTWYTDADGDGYGDDALATASCEAPEGTVATAGDCDDADASYNPGAAEDDCADPNDYNCDGSVGYADVDADGFAACAECDDQVAAVNPDATEVCNGIDDDCDGTVDVGASDESTRYTDADGDGYGDPDAPESVCGEPDGTSADATDCDDAASDVNPGADETWYDGVDQDCDGNDADQDGDGADAIDMGGLDCDDLDPDVIEDCGGEEVPVDLGEYKGGGGCGCGTDAPMSAAGALLVLGAIARRRR